MAGKTPKTYAIIPPAIMLLVVAAVLIGCVRLASESGPGANNGGQSSSASTPAAISSQIATHSPGSPPQTAEPTKFSGLPSSVSSHTPQSGIQPSLPVEVPVIVIPLAGPIADPNAELSGMAWYSDTLILLPQYPSRFGTGDGALFALKKADILAFLDGKIVGSLTPQEVPLVAPGIEKLNGYEGFESITFLEKRVFLTIETKPGKMLAYLISGDLTSDLSQLRLDTAHLAPIQPQVNLANMSDEALLVAGQRIITFDEANGVNVNPKPVAHLFDFYLNSQGTVQFPNIEYRITDVTPPDEFGRFWAINYYYPGDTLLKPAADALAEKYGKGLTHAKFVTIERLVQFQFTENGIIITDTPPIQLQLINDENPRNWEALARLERAGGTSGFLLATDKYPETILGFVAYP